MCVARSGKIQCLSGQCPRTRVCVLSYGDGIRSVLEKFGRGNHRCGGKGRGGGRRDVDWFLKKVRAGWCKGHASPSGTEPVCGRSREYCWCVQVKVLRPPGPTAGLWGSWLRPLSGLVHSGVVTSSESCCRKEALASQELPQGVGHSSYQVLGSRSRSGPGARSGRQMQSSVRLGPHGARAWFLPHGV